MSATTPAPISSHKIRARPSAGPLQTASPHTPLSRSVSGLYGSPGSSFRIDDENLLIFEFGSRCMRAGFAGESAPRCLLRYSPEMWRRVGDYREWEPSYKRKANSCKGFELWESLDVRDLDMGLVEDRVEKVIREAENKYLLLDNRAKKVALAAPSDLPRPVLSILLRRLFEGLQAASVTLLPSSVMACVGAGVRSGIVVDLGWFETAVTAVFEYREVRAARSVRAGKMMVRQLKKTLKRELEAQGKDARLAFEDVEELLCRITWCKSSSTSAENADKKVSIPLPSKDAPTQLELPFSSLAEPAEQTFFPTTSHPHAADAHDEPIPRLLFQTLLALPVDIRNVCLSHITFTGGCSNIPGLKSRILSELQTLVDSQGWDPIRAYAPRLGLSRPSPNSRGRPLSETDGNARPLSQTTLSASPPSIKVTESTTALAPTSMDDTPAIVPAHRKDHDTNPIDAKLAALSLSTQSSQSPAAGTIRAINTLGAWAGASLLTNLRIKGVVEIERERFMSHGLTGGAVPSKAGAPLVPEGGVGYGRSRQSLGPGAKLGEKSQGWSLGVWG